MYLREDLRHSVHTRTHQYISIDSREEGEACADRIKVCIYLFDLYIEQVYLTAARGTQKQQDA